jgi:hypothetical protein
MGTAAAEEGNLTPGAVGGNLSAYAASVGVTVTVSAKAAAAMEMEAAGTAFVSAMGSAAAAAARAGAVQGSPAAALAAVVAEAVARSVGSTAEMGGLGTVVAVLRSKAGTLEAGEKVRAEAKRAEAGQEAPAGGVV